MDAHAVGLGLDIISGIVVLLVGEYLRRRNSRFRHLEEASAKHGEKLARIEGYLEATGNYSP